MKNLILTITLIILATSLSATEQRPDIFIFKGKTLYHYTYILQDYFSQHPEKRPTRGTMTTALFRGYIATIEIRHTEVFIKDIEIELYTENGKKLNRKTESVLQEIFPDEEKRKLTWYSGILILPNGPMTQEGYKASFTQYERYYLLEVYQGNLVKEFDISRDELEIFKQKQFEAFKQTKEYELAIQKDYNPKCKKCRISKKKEFDWYCSRYITNCTTKIYDAAIPDTTLPTSIINK